MATIDDLIILISMLNGGTDLAVLSMFENVSDLLFHLAKKRTLEDFLVNDTKVS